MIEERQVIMKIGGLLTMSTVAVGLVSLAVVPANVSADDAVEPVAVVPPLSYGVSQVIQLSQAQIGDSTIITFIKNSGNSYGLDAPQIIYMRQQGVSEPVISAMLTQPQPGSQPTPTASAPATTTPDPTFVTAPSSSVTVVQAPPPADCVPDISVYVIPDTQTYRYYGNFHPYCGYAGCSSVSVTTIGGGGGYRWGCRGGWYH
jgi:hypothetical protein